MFNTQKTCIHCGRKSNDPERDTTNCSKSHNKNHTWGAYVEFLLRERDRLTQKLEKLKEELTVELAKIRVIEHERKADLPYESLNEGPPLPQEVEDELLPEVRIRERRKP